MSFSGRDDKEETMKKIFLLLIIALIIPLWAEEIWLGMVVGIEGESLLLVDGIKYSCPGLSSQRYITEDSQALDAARITFPFTASVVIDEQMPAQLRAQTVRIKIHAFYEMKDGRLSRRSSF